MLTINQMMKTHTQEFKFTKLNAKQIINGYYETSSSSAATTYNVFNIFYK